jgi:hypothetical protein
MLTKSTADGYSFDTTRFPRVRRTVPGQSNPGAFLVTQSRHRLLEQDALDGAEPTTRLPDLLRR